MEKASSGTSEVSTDTDTYAFVTQLINSAPGRDGCCPADFLQIQLYITSYQSVVMIKAG
ncbi:unnamed protein product [Onchocerca flexuosa]|uniref:Uncharacterized protein n=1 Tax=Onchocerca flexuosa TaxID=387005 RepID=A0A183I5P2_9BILA|nr:unnamed protein product [Onchocerca flexuosa]